MIKKRRGISGRGERLTNEIEKAITCLSIRDFTNYNLKDILFELIELIRDWAAAKNPTGEDPYLTGTMAVAFVRGLQGDDPHYWLTASLMKHFLANSNEDGRSGSSSNFDERLLHEYYSVPFRMGVIDGGSRAYMSAYNAYNGIPMAAQPILREMTMHEWGFDGIICTDAVRAH